MSEEHTEKQGYREIDPQTEAEETKEDIRLITSIEGESVSRHINISNILAIASPESIKILADQIRTRLDPTKDKALGELSDHALIAQQAGATYYSPEEIVEINEIIRSPTKPPQKPEATIPWETRSAAFDLQKRLDRAKQATKVGADRDLSLSEELQLESHEVRHALAKEIINRRKTTEAYHDLSDDQIIASHYRFSYLSPEQIQHDDFASLRKSPEQKHQETQLLKLTKDLKALYNNFPQRSLILDIGISYRLQREDPIILQAMGARIRVDNWRTLGDSADTIPNDVLICQQYGAHYYQSDGFIEPEFTRLGKNNKPLVQYSSKELAQVTKRLETASEEFWYKLRESSELKDNGQSFHTILKDAHPDLVHLTAEKVRHNLQQREEAHSYFDKGWDNDTAILAEYFHIK